jgi:hypothetical protein
MLTNFGLKWNNQMSDSLQHVQYIDAELQRLQALDVHVKAMFDKADADGLYIGLGRNASLSSKAQEGPMVRKLRALAGK